MFGQPGRISALDHFQSLTQKIGGTTEGNPEPQQSQDGKQAYWYVFALHQGKKIMMGPFNDRQDAAAAAREKLPGCKCKVFGLPTRDRSKAVQMVKADMSGKGMIAKALESMRHSA